MNLEKRAGEDIEEKHDQATQRLVEHRDSLTQDKDREHRYSLSYEEPDTNLVAIQRKEDRGPMGLLLDPEQRKPGYTTSEKVLAVGIIVALGATIFYNIINH